MCFDSDYSAEFYTAGIVVARKPHRCDWCRRGIAKGTQYQACSGKSEGEFFSTKICNLCYQDSVTIVKHEIDEGCNWSDAWPPSADDQSEWFGDHEDVRRASKVVDLKVLNAELDMYWKEAKSRDNATNA